MLGVARGLRGKKKAAQQQQSSVGGVGWVGHAAEGGDVFGPEEEDGLTGQGRFLGKCTPLLLRVTFNVSA